MKTRKDKPAAELLAPAGSYASLVAAVNAGADAVYMGGQRFGARAFADNPDADGLQRALEYVHLWGRRLFLTVNTLVKEKEMAELVPFLAPLYEQGLDGVIVQDLGVCRVLRRAFPKLELHASTQMTLCGPEGARLVRDLGICRVVPARELTLEELEAMGRGSGQEVECFIHGALCYSYSGQCLMSSFQGGRSGNRGRCAQPCRLDYEGGRWLNLKDLCALPLLPQILRSGAYSLKIEGRMKSPEYTAGVVRIYRKYLDKLLEEPGLWEQYTVDPKDLEELSLLFDRGGFTKGYFRGREADMVLPGPQREAYVKASEELLAGLRERYGAEQPLPVRGWLRAEAGQPLELTLRRGDEGENMPDAAEAGKTLSAEEAGSVEKSTVVTVRGAAAATAQNRPMTQEDLLRPLKKTGGSDFAWETLQAQVSGEVFAPVSALNALRREAFEALKEEILKPYRRTCGKEAGAEELRCAELAGAGTKTYGTDPKPAGGDPTPSGAGKAPQLTVSLEDMTLLDTVLEAEAATSIYLPADTLPVRRLAETVERVHAAGKKAFLAFPYIFREKMRRDFTQNLPLLAGCGLDGWLIRSLDELGFVREQALPGERVLDGNVYAWNREACAQMAEWGADVLTASFELHEKDLRAILDAFPRWELPVYGRLPMMISAGCVQKTRAGCLKGSAEDGSENFRLCALTDRTGATDPVQLRCRYCYNTIYNSRPLWLADLPLPPVERCRVMLTGESAEEARAVLTHLSSAPPQGLVYTRGHWKKGVD